MCVFLATDSTVHKTPNIEESTGNLFLVTRSKLTGTGNGTVYQDQDPGLYFVGSYARIAGEKSQS